MTEQQVTRDTVRVSLLVNSLAHGGAEHLLVDLVDAASDRIDFDVAYFGGADTLAEEIEAAGAPVESFDEQIRFDPRSFYRCVRYIRRHDSDVVHCHLPYAQTIGRLAAIGTDAAVLSTQHNVPSNYHPVTRSTERVTRPLDDTTVAVSQGVERAFTGDAHQPNELGEDWCTIYNGIDVDGFQTRVSNADREAPRRELGIDSETTVFLSVGRYVEVKAQEELIAAFAQVDTDAELLLVGHGPRETTLRGTAGAHGVADRVHVTGEVPAVEPYYALADVFVSTSRGEGMPVTFLEAMAAKLPVIGTSIPGVEEVVDEQTNGFLYRPGDVSALVALLERLEATELQTKLGEAGYHRVQEKFSIERMADAYVELYQRVTSE